MGTSGAPSVFIGLGSNLGDREATITKGLGLLADHGFVLERRSDLYLTEPVDGPAQDWFVNAVARGTTALGPDALLAACQEVEHALGRVRSVRNGPRTLDLDLLLYGDLLRDDDDLTLPHPRLHQRRFVLVPLCDLAAASVHPRMGVSFAALLAACPDTSRVVPFAAASGAAR
ncbi:MAG: 2-amino-4-hydroxy-6-hydroxymethyldihydropteridine diphosphokinase [Vicinamibacteria bacterium]